MLKLYICRHGEAAMPTMGLKDHERPLTAKGELDAKELGSYLAAHANITKAFCSTATRTRRTLALALNRETKPNISVKHIDLIYNAQAGDLLQLLNEQGAHATEVMLVGHNPTLSQLVGLLSGHRLFLPPAGMAIIGFPYGSWAEVGSHSGTLEHVRTP